ncbi:hypothetical protein CYMTET_15507 [Cymbomonas tetramitiformis]|uniref:Transcription factor 25 n=1 Tax=Cymbomonas tetramitiformis TaxID=36881 RepID=A0AAE0GFC3_9CHLO|nr:hypothetical protein CYMTET_15507 [Cymbomonas tetramitiformis]
MSSRQRARLMAKDLPVHENTLANTNAENSDDGEEEDEDESDVRSRQPVNPFDLLGGEDEDTEEEEEQEQAQADEDCAEDKSVPNVAEPSSSPSISASTNDQSLVTGKDSNTPEDEPMDDSSGVGASKKKRKNKKKNKGKGPAATKEPALMDEVDLLCASIEQAGEKGAAGAGAEAAPASTPKERPRQHILAVDMRHLKAEDELRRIFGSRVMKTERASEKMEARKRNPGHLPRGVGQRAQKKSVLITPREHWPRQPSGLSMEVAGAQDGATLFRYTHSNSYLMVQRQFEECVEAHDPNRLARLVAHNPYHVDALLSLAEVYQQMNDLTKSGELVEQCLYGMECAWHPWFAPAMGLSRLDYDEPENRPFFVALFKHLQALGRSGCHRSAMECCKMLLALDARDPMGSLCCIDYYALMAEQYGFIPRLVDEFRGEDRSLALFPGFAFSLALARFRAEELSAAAGSSKGAPANLKQEDAATESSKAMLRTALLLHPGALHQLIEKLNEKSTAVPVDREWARILDCPLFDPNKVSEPSPSLQRLTSIFVERHHLLYRPPEVQAWLKRVSGEVASEVSAGGEASAEAGDSPSDWAAVRTSVFPPDSEDEYKHLTVAMFSDAISILPPEENPFAQGAGGQVPGEIPEELQAGLAQVLRANQNAEDLRDANPLIAFLRTMLPWVNVADLREGEAEALAQHILQAQQADAEEGEEGFEEVDFDHNMPD